MAAKREQRNRAGRGVRLQADRKVRGRSRTTKVRAFAKINLSLRVLDVRADLYHELRTVFQSIALHDTVTFRPVPGPLRLECSDPACPVDRVNLVWRAAECVWVAAGREGGPRDVAIRVEQRLRRAAGLGGGSSDAPAALRALASLWRVAPARLPETAGSLGADVPYFLEGGTVLGLERGDALFPLLDLPASWVTLAIPSFGVSTKDAYAWWDEDAGRRGEAPREVRNVGAAGVGWLAESERRNDLQQPVADRHPEIVKIVKALRRAGATHAAMSGSGSTVFGLFDRRVDAERAARAIGSGGGTVVTRTLGRTEYQRRARAG